MKPLQPSLWQPTPVPPPSQRLSDTSQDAALSFAPKAGTARHRVLACIASHGPIHAEKIAHLLGMKESTVCGRINELSNPQKYELGEKPFITRHSEDAKTVGGNRAQTWTITQAGRESLLEAERRADA